MAIKNLIIAPGKNLTVGTGKNLILGNFFTGQIRGLSKITAAYFGKIRGLFRVANDALDQYELFVGADTTPDFTTPVATGAGILTYAVPPAPAGSTVVYAFTIRDRNQYNLTSANQFSSSENDLASFSIEVDDAGNSVSVKPSTPFDEEAQASAGGTATFTALYNYVGDGGDAADTWLLYITDDGTDPVVGVTPETLVTMRTVDAFAGLSYTTAAYTTGTVLKAIIVARRTGTGGADSDPTAIVTATADTAGPDAPTGLPFYGTTAAQERTS